VTWTLLHRLESAGLFRGEFGDGDGEHRSAESSGPNGEGRDAVDDSHEHSDAERTDAVKTTVARSGRS
jgi:hypothetical protein